MIRPQNRRIPVVDGYSTPSCPRGIPTLHYKILIQKKPICIHFIPPLNKRVSTSKRISNPFISMDVGYESLCVLCKYVGRVRGVNLDDSMEYDIVVIASTREFNEVSASSRRVFVVQLQIQQK